MTLTLNRSKKMNSFNHPMYVLLVNYLTQGSKDNNVKVILLKGINKLYK